MSLHCYSPTPEVEAALADLFGRRIDELLPDRDINDFALNWDAAAHQCVLYIRRATTDWYRDGATVASRRGHRHCADFGD